jgi:NADH-quinone oxidoreductase subunit A
MLPISLVAYLILFILVGVLALFVSLLIGRFIRPSAPSVTKGESYECGEPAVGSSYIQFDLRFYVVALLFIIFEVELAFFFPPAVVFGKVNQMRGPGFGEIVKCSDSSTESIPVQLSPESQKTFTENHISGLVLEVSTRQLTPAAKEKFAELGVPATSVERITKDTVADGYVNTLGTQQSLQNDLHSLSLMALLDIGVFFVVLLVGFAFLWKQGDLNWVRAIARPAAKSQIKLAVLPHTGEAR